MNGLRASNFKRIYKGLLMDIIIRIVCPMLIVLLGTLLNNLMIDDGYDVNEITVNSVTQYSSVITKLIYVVFIFKYCGSALCYVLVISGLDEVLKLSDSYKRSRKGFLTLILVNAVALTVRMVSIFCIEGEFIVLSESLYAFVEFLLRIVLGASLFTLLRGNMDVLHSLGEDVAAYRNKTLSIGAAISFPLLGILTLADHFAPEMPLAANLVGFVFVAFAWIYTFVTYIRTYLCGREVTRIVSDVSEEVMT